MDNKTIEQRLSAIEDKMAIKYVVDEFSNLADTKEIDKWLIHHRTSNFVHREVDTVQ
jgi:hypothetical protein